MAILPRILLLAAALVLSACGYHLRGQFLGESSNFRSLYLKAASVSPFVAELHRSLQAVKVNLATTQDDADLTLEVVSESTDKQILSISGSGRVREYLLRYRVSLRAYDRQQNDWLPAGEISMARIMSYDDAQVLAMEQEEATIYKELRSDAVSQALRRLSRAKPRPGSP